MSSYLNGNENVQIIIHVCFKDIYMTMNTKNFTVLCSSIQNYNLMLHVLMCITVVELYGLCNTQYAIRVSYYYYIDVCYSPYMSSNIYLNHILSIESC